LLVDYAQDVLFITDPGSWGWVSFIPIPAWSWDSPGARVVGLVELFSGGSLLQFDEG